MSVRVLFILLVISLVFNVAVLIGFVKTRSEVTPQAPASTGASAPKSRVGVPEGKPWFERVSRELRLDEAQQTALTDLQARQQQQSSVFGDSVAVVRQELQEEIRKTEPDLIRIRALVDQEGELVRQRRLAEAELYGDFVNMLTDEQRQRFGQRAAAQGNRGANPPDAGHSPRDGNLPPPDIMRRFDRNKNGRLDADEMKEARRDLQIRRREVAPRVPQLPPLWPWFDANSDGELDPAEQEALLKFLMDHRPAGAESMRPEQFLPPAQREGRGGEGRRRGMPDAETRP